VKPKKEIKRIERDAKSGVRSPEVLLKALDELLQPE